MSGYRIKDIEGYEGRYAVTDDGRVWSYPKKTGNNKYGRWLKVTTSGLYPKVGLYDDYMKCRHVNLHRLMAEAFIPNPENLPQVNHINGDKSDSRLENLEWVTASQNSQHKWDTGLAFSSCASRVAAAKNIAVANKKRRKFIPAEILTIRAMVNSRNFTMAEAAKCFKVSSGTINDIVRRRSYAEVV